VGPSQRPGFTEILGDIELVDRSLVEKGEEVGGCMMGVEKGNFIRAKWVGFFDSSIKAVSINMGTIKILSAGGMKVNKSKMKGVIFCLQVQHFESFSSVFRLPSVRSLSQEEKLRKEKEFMKRGKKTKERQREEEKENIVGIGSAFINGPDSLSSG